MAGVEVFKVGLRQPLADSSTSCSGDSNSLLKFCELQEVSRGGCSRSSHLVQHRFEELCNTWKRGGKLQEVEGAPELSATLR